MQNVVNLSFCGDADVAAHLRLPNQQMRILHHSRTGCTLQQHMAQRVPLVSALVVSRQRHTKLARSIALWWAQSYPRLEMVLAFEEGDRSTATVAHQALRATLTPSGTANWESLSEDTVVHVRRRVVLHAILNTSIALGALRSIVVSLATGEYVTQWDDDDVYHPNRISWTLAALWCSGARCPFSSAHMIPSADPHNLVATITCAHAHLIAALWTNNPPKTAPETPPQSPLTQARVPTTLIHCSQTIYCPISALQVRMPSFLTLGR